MYDNMVFHTADQKLTGPFGKTVDKVTATFHTGSVKGTKSPKGLTYKMPYNGGWHPTKPGPPGPDEVLTGEALKAQATKWAEGGIIEPDAAQALCWTSDYFASGKSLEGVYVVMIGAGSAMGPFPKLLEMGATVVAIDIPGECRLSRRSHAGRHPAACWPPPCCMLAATLPHAGRHPAACWPPPCRMLAATLLLLIELLLPLPLLTAPPILPPTHSRSPQLKSRTSIRQLGHRHQAADLRRLEATL